MTDRKSHEELIAITKTYDPILWSCNRIMERIQTKERLRAIMGQPLPAVPKKIEARFIEEFDCFVQCRYATDL